MGDVVFVFEGLLVDALFCGTFSGHEVDEDINQ